MEDNFEIQVADNSVVKILQSLENQDKYKRVEKIKLLYSYGFVFMPYESAFVNPFFKENLKPNVLTLSYKEIQETINKKNIKTYNEDQVNELFDKKLSQSKVVEQLEYFIGSNSIIIGLLLYFISILLFSLMDIKPYFLIVTQIISICLIHYWISKEALPIMKEEFNSYPSEIYEKYGSIFKIVRVITILLTAYLIYKFFSGFALFVLFALLFVFSLITNFLVMSYLTKMWWAFTGRDAFIKYYNK